MSYVFKWKSQEILCSHLQLAMTKKVCGLNIFTENMTSLHFSTLKEESGLVCCGSLRMCPINFCWCVLRLSGVWQRLGHVGKCLGVRRAARSASPWPGLPVRKMLQHLYMQQHYYFAPEYHRARHAPCHSHWPARLINSQPVGQPIKLEDTLSLPPMKPIRETTSSY